MKRCLSCNMSYSEGQLASDTCPGCSNQVKYAQGIALYAPDSTDSSAGFKKEYFDDLMRMEEKNFWFRARNRILSWVIGTYASPFEKMLEIGCGTGFVLSGLRRAFPRSELSGSEIFLNGLQFAAERLPDVTLMQMDARAIPFEEHYDIIGAFDVLEHIKEDEDVLRQVHQALKPGGHLVLTVPQHKWLWSAMDDYACHARRYTAAELHEKCKAAGFRIERSTSFVTFLLPAMIASRVLKRDVKPEDLDATSELNMNPVLNTIFYWVMRFELLLIRMGVSLPVGGSRLLIARKTGTT